MAVFGFDTLQQAMGDWARRAGVRDEHGKGLKGELLGQIRGYDPYAAAQRATNATVGSLFEQYGNDFRDLRGSQVGTGRLNTGFGGADEDRMTRMFADRVGNVVAQNSLQAAGLDLQNIGNLGTMYGQQLMNDTAQRELQIAQQNARRQERASWASTLGSVGGMIGSALILASDERLKESIEKVGGALAEVKKMKGVEWDWNEQGQAKTGRSGRERGVLAQDVEAVRPDLVHEMDDGTKAVNYTGVVGTVLEATKELDDRLGRIEAALNQRRR